MGEENDYGLADLIFELIVVGAPVVGYWRFGTTFEEAAIALLAVIALGTISKHYP